MLSKLKQVNQLLFPHDDFMVWFSEGLQIFRGYRKIAVVWNGLILETKLGGSFSAILTMLWRPLKWLSQPYLLVQSQQWKHGNNVTSSKFTIKTPRKITSLFAVYVSNFEQFWAHGIFLAIAERSYMCVSGGIKC